MTHQTHVGARLGIHGTLECKDKDGNVLRTIVISGSIPLSDSGLTAGEAQEMINQQEADNGFDNRK